MSEDIITEEGKLETACRKALMEACESPIYNSGKALVESLAKLGYQIVPQDEKQ
jgi:hypothetical protein